jgi:hypothetical protein
MFISLNSITMDLATISFIVLGAIAIAVVSYITGYNKCNDDLQLLKAELE